MNREIIATLPADKIETAKNYGGDKECHAVMHVVALHNGKMRQPITCRFYSARSRSAGVHYCSIWFSGENGRWGSGTGRAGGYGYHKDSAALGDALAAAGVKLSRDINGVGESAMRDALKALALALGYSDTIIVTQ